MSSESKVIDACNAFCPGPLMELIARMKYGSVGDTFELLSTDDGSSVDVPEWVRKAKHELVGSEKVAGVWHITVRKAR